MKICPKCHAIFDDNKNFCEFCGAGLRSEQEIQREQNAQRSGGYQNAGPTRNAGGYQNAGGYRSTEPEGERVIYTDIAPRSIPLAIVLSLVTCGIYVFYWMYKLNNEVNEMAEDVQAPDGLLVVVFSIITCGIYSLYWLYQMGKKCDYISGKDSSSSILFLVLGIFGLGIVAYALIQDTINKAIS